jgi:hypothetical protein
MSGPDRQPDADFGDPPSWEFLAAASRPGTIRPVQRDVDAGVEVDVAVRVVAAVSERPPERHLRGGQVLGKAVAHVMGERRNTQHTALRAA